LWKNIKLLRRRTDFRWRQQQHTHASKQAREGGKQKRRQNNIC
jgi:hypothetical protein